MMDRKMVNFIKEQYPPGTRIRLNSMEDPYAPILPGTEGEVDFVDDAGQLHMKWDNGRSLALIPGEDSFTVLPPKLTTLKLYMPLTADLYERNEYGEFDDCSILLAGSELRGYPCAYRYQFSADSRSSILALYGQTGRHPRRVQTPLHRRGDGILQSRSHGAVPPGKSLSNRPFAWQQKPHYRA